MYKKTNYTSPNRCFRAHELLDEPGFMDIFNTRTNLKVAKLDAETAEYKFTDPHSYIDTYQLNELIILAKALQPNFQS